MRLRVTGCGRPAGDGGSRVADTFGRVRIIVTSSGRGAGGLLEAGAAHRVRAHTSLVRMLARDGQGGIIQLHSSIRVANLIGNSIVFDWRTIITFSNCASFECGNSRKKQLTSSWEEHIHLQQVSKRAAMHAEKPSSEGTATHCSHEIKRI